MKLDMEKNQIFMHDSIIRTIKIRKQESKPLNLRLKRNWTTFRFSLEILLEENRPVVTEKYESEI